MDTMEISVTSALPDFRGQVVIATEASETIDSLIHTFCAKRGISRQSDFVLRNRREEILPNGYKISACGVQSGDELYLMIYDDETWACNCNQWWLLSIACLFIGVCGIVAISVIAAQRDSEHMYTYGIGLDAGSSHTQLYVYRWLSAKDNDTGVVSEIFTCPTGKENKSEAISSFTDDPSKAGPSLRPCLDGAKNVINAQDWSRSPVFLGATAGMRLLNIENATVSNEIMKSVRETISEYPFNSTQMDGQVRIIAGDEEGSFAWISMNYLSGMLGIMPMSRIKPSMRTRRAVDDLPKAVDRPTSGALDLGGASTQIAFSPYNSTNGTDDERQLNLYGNTYNIYTHSYLCYGLNEVTRKYRAFLIQHHDFNTSVTDPCAPKGNESIHSGNDILNHHCTIKTTTENMNYTFTGSSNASLCRNYTLQLFKDPAAPCVQHPCISSGTHQPPVYGNFSAFSGFYYTLRFLNLTNNGSLEDFRAAMEKYCNKTWQEASTIPLRPGESAVEACFRSNYVYALLVDAYRFDESTWNKITFTDQVNGASLGWILGMMVNTTNMIPATAPPAPAAISLGLYILLLLLFAFFLVLAVGFAGYAVHLRASDASRYSQAATTPLLGPSAYGSIEDRTPLGV